MPLDEYRRKRSFSKTPEPEGRKSEDGNQWRFVVQKHAASRLHYDLRLELNGVLLSWAVPKGPSLDWSDKRLAIHVEDHPLEYLEFEGVIPDDEYGGGTVMVWDLGHWTPRGDAAKDYAAGALKFDLSGQKLHGGWMLKRLSGQQDNQWLWIKEKDSAMRESEDFDVLSEMPNSVLSDRDLDEIAADRDAIWSTASRPRETYFFDAAKYDRAKPGKIPSTFRPCMPTATRHAPRGDKWVHEIKYDGYRMLCRIDGGTVRFQSRNGHDWTARLKSLARTMSLLPCDSALLDGEIVMMNAEGVTRFQDLQNRINAGRDGELRYYVFDLPYLNGFQLTALSLLDRKQILAELIAASGPSQRILFSEHLSGDGPTVFQQACKLGAEGIVSKRIDKPYSQGRYEFWLKTKCLLSREFLIGGFTPPASSRQGLGAILMGIPNAARLYFVGKVGTGFTHETLLTLRARLDELRITKSPFANLHRRTADKGTVWVEPKLIAEIEFRGWTGDGIIRHASFRGLREDLDAADLDPTLPPDVSAQEGAHAEHGKRTEVHTPISAVQDVRAIPEIPLPRELATVRITSPDRVVYPDMGITKLGVATYYAQVGHWMLPEIEGRPVSLLRCPGGVSQTCFFQKRAPQGLHESVERIELPTSEGGKLFLVVRDLVGLLALVQFGVLEFHVSGARVDRFDRPDRIVFDLDPDMGLAWSKTVQAAKEVRAWLSQAGLQSFLKTTGGKGLHIVVPLRRRHSWQDVRKFTRYVAAMFERLSPSRFTTNPSKQARKGRILLDAGRNTRGATTVAAYSTRANSKAAVSVPIAWEELDSIPSSDSMSLQAVLIRLARQDTNPWAEIGKVQQSLTKRAWDLLA